MSATNGTATTTVATAASRRVRLLGQKTEKRHLTSHSWGASTRNQRADRWTLNAYPAPCSPRRSSS
jgi:hypothetical protein